MTREIGTLDGGNKNGTLISFSTMGCNGKPPTGDMLGEEGKYYFGLRQELVVGVVGVEGLECSWSGGN